MRFYPSITGTITLMQWVQPKGNEENAPDGKRCVHEAVEHPGGMEDAIEGHVLMERIEMDATVTVEASESAFSDVDDVLKSTETSGNLPQTRSLNDIFTESRPNDPVTSVDALPLDGVHEMLVVATLRQKQFRQMRDASGGGDFVADGVRDDRKCDYPLEGVPRQGSARRPLASRRNSMRVGRPLDHSNSSRAHKPSAGQVDLEESGMAWRRHLKSHVSQLLNELRLDREELQLFLMARYPREDGGSSSDEEPQHDVRSKREVRRRGGRYLNVKEAYERLHRIGMQLGEALFGQLRSMLLRSISNGVIGREANIVRLNSLFSVEVKRQVTLHRIRQVMMTHQEAIKVSTDQSTQEGNPIIRDASRRAITEEKPASRRSDDQGLEAAAAAKTPYHFKMQAIERVLASTKRQGTKSKRTLDCSEELIQEKVTGIVYSKNRDSFPFWKDPPENELSREETVRILRTVVCELAAIPVFHTLSFEQLIEMARATRWKIFSEDSYLFRHGDTMDELLVVFDGQVEWHDESQVDEATRAVYPDGMEGSSGLKKYFGMLGILVNCETWPGTMKIVHSSARILSLAKQSFDAALLKIFGGAKRLIASTHRDLSAPRRPVSSPATSRHRSRSLITSIRPSTSVATTNRSTTLQAYQDVLAKTPSKMISQPEATMYPTLPEIQSHLEMEEVKNDVKTDHGGKHKQANVFQHYPSFSPSTDVGSTGAVPHLFRLKCTQPIAFGMYPLEDSVKDEWAPAFPDTSSLVDYLSSIEKSFLFEKRNILIKSNLRLVCTNLPFQDGLYVGETKNQSQDAADALPSGEEVSRPDAASVTKLDRTLPSLPGLATTIGDGDNVTLGQFAESRRKTGHRTGGNSHLSGSSCAWNLLALTPTSSAKHGYTLFTSSSYVHETSFSDERARILAVVEESEASDEEDEGSLASSIGGPEEDNSNEKHERRSQKRAEVAERPRETRARKMALDSLIETATATSPLKKRIMEQEAARRVIIQKHELALTTGGLTPSKLRQDNQTIRAATADVNASSHARLPLRIDLQRRMEVVLGALKMKAKAKLDLVLKYTHADHYDHFPDAVVLWEQALHYIQKREHALEALRKFELVASDPRRHFRSLSTYRLTEQKERDALFYQLNFTSDLCREALDDLEKRCQDQVFFEHRLYRDKMKKDYTELLYEVEQERLRMIYKGIHPTISRGPPQPPHEPFNRSDPHASNLKQPSSPFVSGRQAMSDDTRRYELSTPRESIYITHSTLFEDDARSEQERQVATTIKVPHAEHKLSAMVKQHRQAQLDAVSNQLSSTDDPRIKRTRSSATEEVRKATPPEKKRPESGDINSLRAALGQMLGRE